MCPNNLGMIAADWPAPAMIRAFTTTRNGGVSKNNFASLNLATHVQDNPQHVLHNRQTLQDYLSLQDASPFWLNQYHSNIVVEAQQQAITALPADASFSRQANTICCVMTADCLPILITNQQGNEIAAIHAGWRGLANGIIAKTLEQLHSPKSELLVWLGPAIGAGVFDVGDDVYEAFTKKSSANQAGFVKINANKWLMNCYQLARLQLNQAGVRQIYGGKYCTYTDASRFFSYRRDGVTGRMASLIYFEDK